MKLIAETEVVELIKKTFPDINDVLRPCRSLRADC